MAEISKITRLAQLRLLCKFLEICKRHSLQCYAEGGTLLGAVRHHGFIPWDDDVDFAMPRADYDRFVVIARKEFSSPYFFQDAHTDTDYTVPICRIRIDGTTGVYYPEMFSAKFHQGIFMDVFPLDEIDSNRLRMIIKWCKIQWWKRLLVACFSQIPRESVIKCLFSYIARMSLRRYFTAANLQDKLHSALRRSGPGSKVGLLCMHRPYWQCVRDKVWYGDPVMIDFSGVKIPCPTNVNAVLCAEYGSDYMVEHPCSEAKYYFDAEISYQDYINISRERFQK